MSLSRKRKARKDTRQTLSGKLIPADTPEPRFWNAVVADSHKDFEEKFGRYITQVKAYNPPDEAREPEYVEATPDKKKYFGHNGRITAGPVQHIGSTNRALRRARLKSLKGGGQLLGSYTREMHRELSEAYGNHWEAKRLLRERSRAAATEAQYEVIAS